MTTASFVPEQPATASSNESQNHLICRRAEGTFDVKNTPVVLDEGATGATLGRFALVKQYHGELQAIAKGEMLGAGNPDNGGAGYVAIEQITGTLHGRTGSFAVQHFGSLEGSSCELNVRVVPGSGTDELEGITGAMTFALSDAKHIYAIDYVLPQSR